MIAGLPEEELFMQGHAACAGCGAAIAMRHVLKASGKNVIVAHATGCMEVVSSAYPLTAWRVPWIHAAFENVAAVASGIERALKVLKKDTKVLAIGGDGGTFDIGIQALSGAVERNHDFCYVCYDNGAYANTGVQRSGATPKFADTTTSPYGKKIHGKQEFKKNMPMIIAAHHENVYVATANIGYPLDFYNKVKKGLEHKGPAYIQVFTPCVPGWNIASNKTIEICRLAFNSGITPLYEIEKGVLKFNSKPSERIPVNDYLKLQGRFKYLTNEEITEIQKHVDSEFKRLTEIEKAGVRL